MDEPVVTPDHVPLEWPVQPVAKPTVCTCAVPFPQARAKWKGASRTYCGRCGLPVRLDFDRR